MDKKPPAFWELLKHVNFTQSFVYCPTFRVLESKALL